MVECFENLAGGPDPDWAQAAWALIQDPQDWTAKEELLLQVVTEKSNCYGPPKTLTDFSPFFHLEALDAEGGTRLVKLYTALGEVLKQAGPGFEGGPEMAQGMDLQKWQDAWCYFIRARKEINEKLEGSSYQLIPAEAESGPISEPPSFFGADSQAFGQSLNCSSLSRPNFCPPLQPQSSVCPTPPLGLASAGLTLMSGLTVESFKDLAGCDHPDWENAARALIIDFQDWHAKEKLLLQVVTDECGLYGRPQTLTEFQPFHHLKPIDAAGGTRLVKLYTAIGHVLRQSWAGSGDSPGMLGQVDEGTLRLAWNYFVGARAGINEKLRCAPTSRWSPYQLIPEYAEDAFYTGGASCSYVNAQLFEQSPGHASWPQFPPEYQSVAYSVPSSSSFAAVGADDIRGHGSQTHQPIGVISKTVAPQAPQEARENLGKKQVQFLCARIAAHGVEVQTDDQTKQWLAFEIDFSRGDALAAGSQSALSTGRGFASQFGPPPEGGAGGALRVINIPFGSELKPIPVCRLGDGILTTPSGKKYKYPPEKALADYVATHGYKARTPEGSESMYLVFAQPKKTFEAEAIDLNDADIPLFMGFVSRIKNALASDELIYRKPICSYKHALRIIRQAASYLWEQGLNGLQWICNKPKDTNWTEALNSVGFCPRKYAWAVQWFCDTEEFAENLIPAESNENYLPNRGGKLTRSPFMGQPWILNLSDVRNNFETNQTDFLRARIAADGLEMQTHGKIKKWLAFEITSNLPRGHIVAADPQSALSIAGGFAPRFVPLPEGGIGAALRVIDIPLGSELKSIPVCRLESEILITPSGKKYKYPREDKFAAYMATYGYQTPAPGGGENRYVVFAQPKEKFEVEPGDLNADDLPLFMDFVKRIKETLASNDLKHRWTLDTYRNSLSTIRSIARHLWRNHKEGLAWVCAQPKTTNWIETFNSFGPPLSHYALCVQWFCQNERFAEKLIPAEGDEDDRPIPAGGLTHLPGPSGLSNKRANGDPGSLPLSKQSR